MRPQAEPLPAGGARAPGWRTWLALALVALVVSVRKTDALANPQLWAEDAWIFFHQQHTQGARALLVPYSGYLHLVPRLVALAVDACAPLAWVPAAYAWTSLLVLLVVARQALSPRLELPCRVPLALALVLVPHVSNEVFLNLANLQSILVAWTALLLVRRDPDPARGDPRLLGLADGAALVLCGLTGPFAPLFLPLFLLRWLRQRSRHRAAMLALALAVALVQGAVLWRNTPPSPAPSQLGPHALAVLLGQKAFGGLVLGTRLPYRLSPALLCALFAATWGVALAGTRGRQRAAVACFLAVGALPLAAVLVKFRSRPDLLVAPGAGMRYFYGPALFTTWALVVLACQPERWKRAVALALLALVLASSLASGFRSEPLEDLDWRGHSARIGREPGLRVPVHPGGRFLEFPGG